MVYSYVPRGMLGNEILDISVHHTYRESVDVFMEGTQ